VSKPRSSLRTALVTGASAGLGRELVRQLVRDRGMIVLATARRLDRLEALAAEFPEGRVLTMAGDLADPDFRAALWERAEALPGGVDLLVNNAGLGRYEEFADQDFAPIRAIFEVNVMALMDLTQRAARTMRARGSGQILEISSVLGFVGLPCSAAYVASKHAVNGLVKSLRYELRGSGVRVWAACPGRTESEFAQVALADPEARGPLPKGAPTAKVVRAIVRGIDGRRVFLMPTFVAWATVAVAHWLPGLYEWVMARVLPRHFRAEINRARLDGDAPGPSAP
jgi:short-subunit dehydrogenase